MGVKELLAAYLERIGETDAIDAIAEAEGVRAAVQAVATTVRDAMQGTGDPDDLSVALTWIRDATVGNASDVVRAGVRACVPTHLTPALVEALVAPVHVVRSQAIYTIAKMGFRDDRQFLLNVFERYLDRDPLLVPKLIDEFHWLGGDSGPLLTCVRRHPHYLTRWSFFGTHAARVDGRGTEELRAACAEFESDQAVVVQAEARHVLAEIAMVAESVTEARHRDPAARRAHKRRRAEHAATAPLLFVHDVELGFRFNGRPDYDVSELDAFVTSLLR